MTGKIGDHQAKEFEVPKVEIKPFQPKNLQSGSVPDYRKIKKEFGSLASTDPSAPKAFSLHPESRKLLGVEQEERKQIADMVSSEVERQVEAIRTRAYQEGFQKGEKDGFSHADQSFRSEVEPKMQMLVQLLQNFDAAKQELYEKNEKFLIQMIFQISKTVLLRELKQDRDYLRRLTAQIIEKVGAKDHVRVRISSEDFRNIETLREEMKTQFPEMKNIQIEVSEDIELGGCQVETDLSRINATLETQFEAIEKSLKGEVSP